MPEELIEAGNPDHKLVQSLHPFEALPTKVQRVWMEAFGDTKDDRLFYICSWQDTECGIFSDGEGLAFQTKSSAFASMGDLRHCSRVTYIIDDIGGIEFMENSILTDNREESWVDDAGEALIALAAKEGLPLEPANG